MPGNILAIKEVVSGNAYIKICNLCIVRFALQSNGLDPNMKTPLVLVLIWLFAKVPKVPDALDSAYEIMNLVFLLQSGDL